MLSQHQPCCYSLNLLDYPAIVRLRFVVCISPTTLPRLSLLHRLLMLHLTVTTLNTNVNTTPTSLNQSAGSPPQKTVLVVLVKP
jgi:hypothetical protein